MKQLFWKEWYELRWLPLMSAVCVVMLLFGAKVFNTASDPNHALTVDDSMLPLVMTWAICAVLAGAGLIAQEVGSGGLQFLSALPTSRRCLWCVKVLTGLGMLLLSVIACTVAWAVIDAFTFRAAFFAFFENANSATEASAGMNRADLVQFAGEMLLSLLGFFSVGLAVSPFLDRSISAVVAALLLGIGCFAAVETLSYLYVNYYKLLYGWQGPAPHLLSDGWMCVLLVCLSIPVLVAVSYWTFTRGESLRSTRRFRVGAFAGLASLAVAGMVFLAGFTLHLW